MLLAVKCFGEDDDGMFEDWDEGIAKILTGNCVTKQMKRRVLTILKANEMNLYIGDAACAWEPFRPPCGSLDRSEATSLCSPLEKDTLIASDHFRTRIAHRTIV